MFLIFLIGIVAGTLRDKLSVLTRSTISSRNSGDLEFSSLDRVLRGRLTRLRIPNELKAFMIADISLELEFLKFEIFELKFKEHLRLKNKAGLVKLLRHFDESHGMVLKAFRAYQRLLPEDDYRLDRADKLGPFFSLHSFAAREAASGVAAKVDNYLEGIKIAAETFSCSIKTLRDISNSALQKILFEKGLRELQNFVNEVYDSGRLIMLDMLSQLILFSDNSLIPKEERENRRMKSKLVGFHQNAIFRLLPVGLARLGSDVVFVNGVENAEAKAHVDFIMDTFMETSAALREKKVVQEAVFKRCVVTFTSLGPRIKQIANFL